MLEVYEELFKYSPLVAMLVTGIVYFVRKEKKYSKELKDERENCEKKLDKLNIELKESEKENLLMLSKLADSFEKLSQSNFAVKHEIQNFKEIISIKLENIRNGS